MADARAQFERFEFDDAAASWGSVARDATFPRATRAEAAENAAKVYAALGQRERVVKLVALAQGLTPASRVTIAHVLSAFDYRVWRRTVTPSGDGRAARNRAATTLERFITTLRGDSTTLGSERVLEATWRRADIARVAADGSRDTWLARTVSAWQRLAALPSSSPSLTFPFVDYGAEAAFELLERAIDQKPPSMRCTPASYVSATIDADAFDAKLDALERSYSTSLEWLPAILAERGYLHDRLLQLLDWCRPGAQFPSLQPTHPTIASPAKRTTDTELMVRYYAQALAVVAITKEWSEPVDRARRRMAYHAPMIPSSSLRAYVEAADDPLAPAYHVHLTYRKGMFERGGRLATPPPNEVALPVPRTP